MKIAFVTNICAHYRIRTFELLSEKLPIDFFFFSAGKEWYWQQEHGIHSGIFNYQYLSGFSLGRTRISLGLPWKLWINKYDVYIKGINGKFALPITYFIARLKGKPFILWTGIWMRLQTLTHRIIYPITKYIYIHSDAVVVYGDHVKRFLVSEGVSPERIFVANHAVDNQLYNADITTDEKSTLRKSLKIEGSDLVVLYLGRLEESKGIEYLLHGFKNLKKYDNTVLVIAGTGNQENIIKQKAIELGINNQVRFPGYVDYSDAAKYFSLATIFVLPSISMSTGKEPWGLVINEAFNQGLPVVVSDAVGAASGGLVEDGINGFVVPERDSTAITSAITDILDDDQLRGVMSNNARTKISNWNNEKMVHGFTDAVDYVLSQRT